MGNWYRIIATIIISTFCAILVTAQNDGNTVIVDSAFVRSGPGDSYSAVGALYNGDDVFPLNNSADGLWILIPYSRGYGWIQRSLVRWEDEDAINRLVPFPANFTPTPLGASTSTPFIPTTTPEGNYVNIQGAASAYVRAGPGRGYLRMGQLLAGASIEPVARNENSTWLMIRYSDDFVEDGFAWIAVALEIGRAHV